MTKCLNENQSLGIYLITFFLEGQWHTNKSLICQYQQCSMHSLQASCIPIESILQCDLILQISIYFDLVFHKIKQKIKTTALQFWFYLVLKI